MNIEQVSVFLVVCYEIEEVGYDEHATSTVCFIYKPMMNSVSAAINKQ